MSLDAFQIGCVLVLAIAYAFHLRDRATRARRAAEVALLAASGWLGEQSCISLYRFYAYAPGWAARAGDVPALVPLIWPLVVLSARDVARAMWPEMRVARRAAVVGALVVLDASLMEVVAVAAGLWRWAEPGYLDVPVIGILGWGAFAVGASLALDVAERGPRWLLALPAIALPVTHAILLALWWGALRWVGRGDLGPWAIAGFAALPAAISAGV
ncbi:MAG TPA: carotenoid biosynthesis protein, partial [Planctomycetota bacterium]|nr:carotenoid biosynthesis protein [Planctomycetota bacterium]